MHPALHLGYFHARVGADDRAHDLRILVLYDRSIKTRLERISRGRRPTHSCAVAMRVVTWGGPCKRRVKAIVASIRFLGVRCWALGSRELRRNQVAEMAELVFSAESQKNALDDAAPTVAPVHDSANAGNESKPVLSGISCLA